MPATLSPGQVSINLGPGKAAYVNLIYSGPGFFVIPVADLMLPPGAPPVGTWTSCPYDPAGPIVPPPLPLTEGQYILSVKHDPGTCVAPRGATPMDVVVRSDSFGPDMYSFTLGKAGTPATCDIIVVIQSVGGGGGAVSDSGATGALATMSEAILQSEKINLKLDLVDLAKKLRRFYNPIPPEPPIEMK